MPSLLYLLELIRILATSKDDRALQQLIDTRSGEIEELSAKNWETLASRREELLRRLEDDFWKAELIDLDTATGLLKRLLHYRWPGAAAES